MSKYEDRTQELQAEIEGLRLRLQEAEDTLDAIRTGGVDALVVSGPDGEQVYTLTGTNRPYRVLFETMNEGAATLSSDGIILFCNTKLSEMFKTPMELIAGSSIFRFTAEEDAASLAALLDTGLEKPQKKEIALKCSDGRVIPCQISASPLPLEDSSAICMIVTDLTQRKQSEEAQRGSEERFWAIFEATQDLVWVKDRDLKITHLNSAMAKIFGRPSEELIGLNPEELFGDDTGKYMRELDLRVLSGQSIEEQRGLSINGMEMVWDIVKVPLRDTSDGIIGLCAIARDVTDWRQRAPHKRDTSYPSEAMNSTLNMAQIAAKKRSTVLLQGESGSGKDYVAKYIHDHSERSSGPYFSINCAAIPSELAESELFGHEKGAFTGAGSRKRGLIELAEGGTLLLNEIGELPLLLQAKLLTFLDTRQFTRVGGEKEISVNVRLLAATNRDLEKEIEEGRFRQDLFYRLNVMTIRVPPLRERRDDIPMLIEEIVADLRTELQFKTVPKIEPSTIEILKVYHWPGNVRELRNVLERAAMLSSGPTIDPAHLGLHIDNGAPATQWSFKTSFPFGKTLQDVTDELTRSLLLEMFKLYDGNKTLIAKNLGIARDSVYRYMKKFGLEDKIGDD